MKDAAKKLMVPSLSLSTALLGDKDWNFYMAGEKAIFKAHFHLGKTIFYKSGNT
jgi:hypothetical protein